MTDRYIEMKKKNIKSEVLRYLGFVEGKTALPEKICKLVDQYIKEANEIIYPIGIYKVFPMKAIDEEILWVEEEDVKFFSKDVTALMNECKYITVIGVTVGKKIDEMIDTLFQKGEYTKASIFDAIASDSVEQATNLLCKEIEAEAKQKNMKTTMRFSPGYGDFGLENQKKLLKILHAEKIQLNVSQSNMLIPRKSVTAVLGWRKEKVLNEIENKCIKCNVQNCRYRNDLSAKHVMDESKNCTL